MTARGLLVRLAGLAALLLAAVVAYLLVLRPWQLSWGATDEEVARSLPGDEIVSSPDFDATRAVTVRARPEKIWPWIVQMGDQRAGFYSYDWLDNRGRRSAERIIPELQRLEVGDRIPLSPWSYEVVHAIDPPRSMVWVGTGDPPSGSWTWVLEPLDARRTRLITRLRGTYDWSSPFILLQLWVDWGDLPFMRKSMLGIQQRAEGEIRDSYAADRAEGLLWGVAFLQFVTAVVLMMRRREWWRPWMVAVATAAVFLLIFYARPSLWVGVLSEATILAGLLWAYRTTTRPRERGTPSSPA